jgi:hypothetical protein
VTLRRFFAYLLLYFYPFIISLSKRKKYKKNVSYQQFFPFPFTSKNDGSTRLTAGKKTEIKVDSAPPPILIPAEAGIFRCRTGFATPSMTFGIFSELFSFT